MRNAAVPVEKPFVMIPEHEQTVNPREEKKLELRVINKRRTGTRLKAVLWIALIFAAFFTVTSRYSNLTKLNYEIADIKSSLEEQNSINSALSVELDKKTNIMKIMHSAEMELGMHKPNNHQLVFINVPRANKAVVQVKAPDDMDETVGFLNNIKAFIGGN